MSIDNILTDPNITLKPKQLQIVKGLLFSQFGLLQGEQGVGKTLMCIFIIKAWLRLGLIKKVLIITRSEVVLTFKETLLNIISELQSEDVKVFSYGDRDLFSTDAKIYICDYNNIKMSYYEREPKSKEINPDTGKKVKNRINKNVLPMGDGWGIVLDEVQALKNTKSDVYKIVHKNTIGVSSVVASSGTPIEKIEEIYAIFNVINPEIMKCSEYTFLNTIACLAPGSFRIEYYRKEGVERMWKRVDPYIHRIKKTDLGEMVEKKVLPIEIEMDEEFKHFYNFVVRKMKDDLRKPLEEGEKRRTIANLIHPIYNLIKEIKNTNPRFRKFDSLVRRIVSNEKLVVWDGSPEVLDNLAKYYEAKGIKSIVVHGEVDITTRRDLIKKFNENEEYRILFISYLSNKDAWEIPSRPDMKRAIFYSIPDRMTNFFQATDRLHRMNSTEPVTNYVLVLKGSIDEWAKDLIEYKEKMVNGLMSKEEFDMIEKSSLERLLGFRIRY